MKWFGRTVLGLLAATTVLGPARVGDAQTPTATAAAIGGLQGSAAAIGIKARYNPEGLLPIPPPVDLGVPDAYTTIASGPATFARAGVADPGDLLYSPDALLLQASEDYPGGIPPWPYRVTAASGSGAPRAESNPAPGLNARVEATSTGSLAQATMPMLATPAVASAGSALARATTATDGSVATVTSRSQVTDFDLLGLLKIDSVITELQAVSEGKATTITGGTRISGATFMGMPVIIDAEGIHQDPAADPLLAGVISGLLGNINDAVNASGIKVTLASPVDLGSANPSQRTSTGLRIDLEFSPRTAPQLAALLDMLPPIDNPIPGAPVSPEDLIAAARARHLTNIDVATAMVNLTARPAAVFGRTTTPTTPLRSSTIPSFGGASPLLPLPSVPTPVLAGPVVDPEPIASDLPLPPRGLPLPAAAGVGALVLMALLATPFFGQILARISMAVLAPQGALSCPEEQ